MSRYDDSKGRVYVWETVDIDEQDCGANDEGYYYAWCPHCERRTEQGDSMCFSCNQETGN